MYLTFKQLTAATAIALAVGTAQAQTTTAIATGSWTDAGIWDNGVPSGTIDETFE